MHDGPGLRRRLVSVRQQSSASKQFGLRRSLASFYWSTSQSSASINAEHQLPAELALQCLAWTSSRFGFSPAAILSFDVVWTPSQLGFSSTGPPRSLQLQSMPNISFQLSFRFNAWPGLRRVLASVRQQSSASKGSGLRRSLASVLQVHLAVFSPRPCRTSSPSRASAS